MNHIYAALLAGLPHIDRNWKERTDMAAEVKALCDQIEAAGIDTGYTPEIETACRAALANEELFYVNEMYWLVYDQQRDAGEIPAAQPEGTWEP